MILLFFRGEFLVQNKYARYYRSKHFLELKKYKTHFAYCTSLIKKKKDKIRQRVFLLPTLCSVNSLILHVQMSPLFVHGGLSLISWSLISRFFSPHIRESGIRQNFCLWNPESLALESGIQLKESVHPLTKRIQNPSFTEKGRSQCLESGIHGVDSRSKNVFYVPLIIITVLDFLLTLLLLEFPLRRPC